MIMARSPAPDPMRSSIVEEKPESPRPARVLQLPQRLRLDLPDALARHRELLANLFQSVVFVHPDAEAHTKTVILARGARGENACRGLAQFLRDSGLNRLDRVLVSGEIAEGHFLFVADR